MANILVPSNAKDMARYQMPTQRISLGFQLMLSAANGALWLAVLSLFRLLIPAQIETIDPANNVSVLFLLTFVTGTATLLSQPLSGALSDWTISRFGRHLPWIAGGMLLSIGGLIWTANAHSGIALAFSFGFLGYAFHMLPATMMAMTPDRVPVSQYAPVSDCVGRGQPLGTLVGPLLIFPVKSVC